MPSRSSNVGGKPSVLTRAAAFSFRDKDIMRDMPFLDQPY